MLEIQVLGNRSPTINPFIWKHNPWLSRTGKPASYLTTDCFQMIGFIYLNMLSGTASSLANAIMKKHRPDNV